MYEYIKNISGKNGSDLPFSEETFTACAHSDPASADIAAIADKDPDNTDFLNIMYYKFTGKLPDEKDISYWAGHIEKDSRSDFRKLVTEYFSEKYGSEKTIINNIF